MLIHSLPQTLSGEGRALFLPPYTRAPLGLVEGSTVYCAYRQQAELHDRGLFVTPYHPDSWSDLWRMEIQFKDEPGQLNRLIELFDTLNIQILHATSRNSFKSSFHVKYFMLDCTKYESDVDHDNGERYTRSIDDLIGLRFLLQLKFISSIRLLDDGRPRLRISRNLVHLNMEQDWKKPDEPDKQLMVERTGIKITNRRIPVPSDIALNDKTYAVMTTNAKAHVIYCAFNDGQERQSCHVYFHFDGSPGGRDARRLAHITRLLAQNKFNIIRSQLRQGLLPPSPRNKLKGTQLAIASQWPAPFTLNLMIEAQGALAIRGSTIFERLDAVFAPDIADGKLFMFESPPKNLDQVIRKDSHEPT